MFYTFAAVSLLFIAGLILRRLFKRLICALCVAVALTWIALLILYEGDRFHDQALLGLLMGSSVTGIFYFVQKRLPKAMRIFSLPFFLSLMAAFYLLVTNNFILSVFILLTALWIVAWIIFSWRNDPAKTRVANVVMECCENDK